MPEFLGTQTVPIDELTIDSNIQPREKLSAATIADYAEIYRESPEVLPALTAFNDGTHNLITRGFHRHHGAVIAKITHLRVQLYRGTYQEAMVDAMADNREHGLRYSKADKRKMVRTVLQDTAFAHYSNEQIAEVCGVGRNMVGQVKTLMKKAAEKALEKAVDEAKEGEGDDSYEGEEAFEEEMGPKERMDASNKAIESYCRKLTQDFAKVTDELAKDSPWLNDKGRLTTAKQSLSTVVSTLRACKGAKVCFKCGGEGCAHCRMGGWLDATMATQLEIGTGQE